MLGWVSAVGLQASCGRPLPLGKETQPGAAGKAGELAAGGGEPVDHDFSEAADAGSAGGSGGTARAVAGEQAVAGMGGRGAGRRGGAGRLAAGSGGMSAAGRTGSGGAGGKFW